MNVNLDSYAKDHLMFCRSFLEEKGRKSPTPESSKTILHPEERTKSELNLNQTLDRSTSPHKNSKLLTFKKRILNALKNRVKVKFDTPPPTISLHREQSHHFFPGLDKLSPTLYNTVKMFGMKVRRIGYLNDLSGLNKNDLNIINDQTYYEEEKTWKSMENIKTSVILSGFMHFFLQFTSFFQKLLKCNEIMLFHPYSRMKLLWEFLVSLLIIFMMFYIPLSLAFTLYWIESGQKMAISIVFVFDMILEMNTLYFYKGLEVRSRAKIFLNYIQGYFIPDLISLSSLFLDYKAVMGLLFFFKVFSLKKFSKKITNRFKLSRKWKGVKDLTTLFLLIIFIAHLAACGWHFVGVTFISDSSASNWIKEKGLLEENWQIRYMSSFYWSIVTVMTVGYGDITPVNNSERLYCLLVILFGGMIFPYSINSIGNIIQDIKKEKKRFEDTLDVISAYMRRKNINSDLQTRIREYLNFIWNEEKTQNIEEEAKIINSLSASLKDELNLESFGFFVKNNPLFMKFFSNESLKNVVNNMKEMFLTPDDVIFQQNQLDDNPAIYFIEKGTVKIYCDLNNTPVLLKELKAGEYFGERSFFTNQPRENTAISSNFATIFMIKQKDFLSTISKNKSDYENFCIIKEKLLFYNDYSYIQKSCFCCGRYSHTIEDCPRLHFIPNIEKIIKKYNFPKTNTRLPFHRRPKKKTNVLLSYPEEKKVSKPKKQKQSVAFDEREEVEESNFEGLEESENYENSEIPPSSKRDAINSFAYNKKEPASPSIVINNSSNNELKFTEIKSRTVLTTKNSSSERETRSMKLGEGNPFGSDARLQEITLSFDIDRVSNFKRYFPTFNIRQIIKNYQNSCTLTKEIVEKYIQKYKNLKDYTFFVNPILEKFLSQKNKLMKQKSNFKLKNCMTMKRKSVWAQQIVRTPLQKKNFFEIQVEKKKKVSNFSDMISNLVVKNRQSNSEMKRKTVLKVESFIGKTKK